MGGFLFRGRFLDGGKVGWEREGVADLEDGFGRGSVGSGSRV